MAFDITKLFSPEALNMLLQPATQPPQKNMLLTGNVPYDPSANAQMAQPVLPQQGPVPQPAPSQMPMPQAAQQMQSPAPQMAAQPMQVAQAGGNPLANFFNDDRKAYLNDMFTGWASGKDVNQSLGLGAQLAGSNSRDRKQTNETVDWLKKKGMPEDQAKFLAKNPAGLSEYLKSIYGKQAQDKILNVSKGGSLYDPASGQWITPPAGAGGAETPEYGLAPVYGIDAATGKPGIGQLSKDGKFHVTDLGGFTPTPGVNNIDTGTAIIPQDKRTGELGTPIAKDVSGRTEAEAAGKNTAEAKSAFPQVESAANQMLKTIDDLATDPYLDRMVGPADSRLMNVSGEANRVQSKMDQIGGQAFLQAFNSLRGAGQITEVEGSKATASLARLNTAQNETDYKAALKDLRDIVSTGLERSRSRVSQTGVAPAAPVSGGGIDDLVKKWGG